MPQFFFHVDCDGKRIEAEEALNFPTLRPPAICSEVRN
jgi:hypothetical protein